MNNNYLLNTLLENIRGEVENHILPYWIKNVIDNKNGGFHGRIRNDNTVVHDSPRSIILNARILWTFSAAYRVLREKRYLFVAERAYNYIMNHFWDDVNGGVYWMVDQNGQPTDLKKHAYAQAFAVYGLSEYYRATSDVTALTRGIEIYNLLKQNGNNHDGPGYHEAFSCEWEPLSDVRLSDKDDEQKRSMNTHLHLFEAYTNLYRVWPNEDLKTDIVALFNLFFGPMYNKNNGHFFAFFDEQWNPTTDIYSYGHDIEAVWLLFDSARVLGDDQLIEIARQLIRQTAEVTLQEGIDPERGGIYQSGSNGTVVYSDKHWWVQAEGIVGFVYAYSETGNEEYLQAAVKLWEFIDKYIIDSEYGEWYFRVNQNGEPYLEEDKVGAWKCPYHNVRAGLELVEKVRNRKKAVGENDGDM